MTVPVKVAAIAIYVAVLTAQFTAFVARGRVVAAVEVAPKLAAIVSDLGLVVTDIAVQTSVTIPGQRGRYAHSD